MRNTIAVHVRYKSLYISLPSSAEKQREMTEMTKLCLVYETWTTTANCSYFHFELTSRRCIFSSSTLSEPLANRTDLENRKFRR